MMFLKGRRLFRDGNFDGLRVNILRRTARAGAELVILRIDTPGGMLEPTRVLIQAILDSPVPIVGYVTPAGARASSAGTYILAATHVAVMAPATNVGSAKPVFIGFGEIDEDAKLKATNDASAQMRALAQLRNRNADWLEQSVVAAKNITAEEALGLGVIDLIAVNQKDLLKQLQGRRVQMGEGDLVLETTDLEAKEGTPFEVFFLADNLVAVWHCADCFRVIADQLHIPVFWSGRVDYRARADTWTASQRLARLVRFFGFIDCLVVWRASAI